MEIAPDSPMHLDSGVILKLTNFEQAHKREKLITKTVLLSITAYVLVGK